MSKSIFALIDCNNFFVSCEQIFRPDLEGKPVVVLSSNDGCVVARSPEAKALSIPMAAPAFKYKEILARNSVVQFSANFELYGDISRRITEILTSVTPRLEVYSIDESFLDISQLDITDYDAWGQTVRDKIKQWIGVNVSIGVAPTKTLAKLASQYAKNKGEACQYVRGPTSHILQDMPLEDVWGIGRANAPKLRSQGLATARDLASLTPAQGRQLIGSVNGERLVRELQGQSCLPLERIHKQQKMISATRTFGEDTSEPHVVEAAMASFAARAGYRLRSQHQLASKLTIFASSSYHKPGYKRWSRELLLDQPTADTGLLNALANKLFIDLYDGTATYHRAGVLLENLSPDDRLQTDLLGKRNPKAFDKSKRRMQAIDQINSKYGQRTVHYSAEDLAASWQPKRNLRSPRYTTVWTELPKVQIQ